MWGQGTYMGFMGDWGGFGWTGPFGIPFGLIFLVVIVALAVWFFRGGRAPGSDVSAGRSQGLTILEERYARGEIDRDEYLRKKRDLAG